VRHSKLKMLWESEQSEGRVTFDGGRNQDTGVVYDASSMYDASWVSNKNGLQAQKKDFASRQVASPIELKFLIIL